MNDNQCLFTTRILLCFSSSAVTSQRPSSHGSNASTALHLALSTTTTMSHPMTPTFGHPHHGSLFPHFPSFHPHPGALGYPHGPAGESPFPYPSNAPGFRHGLHIAAHHPPLMRAGGLRRKGGVGFGVDASAESCTFLGRLGNTLALH